jgi:hypothetical protein
MNNKNRLFEMMGKINNNFNSDDISGDVENLTKLRTPAEKTALSRINTQKEFNEAFVFWFNTLGVSGEYKDRINITTSISFIRDYLEKNGIKN